MTMSTIHRWTCERCGREEETAATSQAKGWIAVIAVAPPLAVPEDPAFRKHLCGECANAFEAFMEPA